jgi:hypothetical protein
VIWTLGVPVDAVAGPAELAADGADAVEVHVG